MVISFGFAPFGGIPPAASAPSIFAVESSDVLSAADDISSVAVFADGVVDAVDMLDAVSSTGIFSAYTADILNPADAVLDADSVISDEFTYLRFSRRLFYPAVARYPLFVVDSRLGGERASPSRETVIPASQREASDDGGQRARPGGDAADDRLAQSPSAPRAEWPQSNQR